MKTLQVDVAIIGAGTAGLYALREVKRAKKSGPKSLKKGHD